MLGLGAGVLPGPGGRFLPQISIAASTSRHRCAFVAQLPRLCCRSRLSPGQPAVRLQLRRASRRRLGPGEPGGSAPQAAEPARRRAAETGSSALVRSVPAHAGVAAASRCRRRDQSPGRLEAVFYGSCSASRSRADVRHRRRRPTSITSRRGPSDSRGEPLGHLRRGARGDPRRGFPPAWATNFLDDLAVDVRDVRYANGVMGKLRSSTWRSASGSRSSTTSGQQGQPVRHRREAQGKRDHHPARLLHRSGPDSARRGVVRELYAEKGYQFAEVKPEIKEVAGGPKLVHLTFNITEGPKVRIRDIDFVGNQAGQRRQAGEKMKENKEPGFFSFITAAARTRKTSSRKMPTRFSSTTATRAISRARVGQPELKVMEDSRTVSTRWVQLRVPVTEGKRYQVGDFNFEGNTIVKAEALRPLFKLKAGEFYSEKHIARGSRRPASSTAPGGYFEFTATRICSRATCRRCRAAAMARHGADGPPRPRQCRGRERTRGPRSSTSTMRVNEGKQYFVNRITFIGNTTTRDNVIRRELRLVEAGVFNTEALKYSIRRLNQLGYFKPLEGEAISGREDAGRRQQGRRHAQVRGAEPQPADVRRRRLAVRGFLRAAVVPDVELPRPRRDVDAVARRRATARRTTRSPSPSRFCSIGR